MKILMVITEGDMGGAQRHVLDLSRELQSHGNTVTIAVGGVFTDLSVAAEQITPKIIVHRLRFLVRNLRLFQDVRAFFELVAYIRIEKPDIIHCHSSKAGGLASVAGWVCNVPTVYTAHGFVFREDISFFRRQLFIWFERIASIFRAKIITVSQSDFDAACAYHIVSRKKLVTIPNGIDERWAQQILSPAAARAQLSSWTNHDVTHAKIVVAIANLYPAKNIPLLIQAFEFVVRRLPVARLVIVGDGEQRSECEKIISARPVLVDTVFLVGKRAHAYQILSGADALCLASTKEGMPYAILEAKLAGIPVVATRVGGVPEMGEEPMLTLVVPHSAELLADAITNCLRSNMRGVPGEIQKKFTLSGMVEAIEAVYRETLGSGHQ